MIDPGNREHSDQIQSEGDANRRPAPTHDKNTEEAEMEKYEWKAAEPVDSVEIADSRRYTPSVRIRIKPLDQKSQKNVRAILLH